MFFRTRKSNLYTAVEFLYLLHFLDILDRTEVEQMIEEAINEFNA